MIVTLVSGGMDSYIGTLMMGDTKEVVKLHFDHGNRANKIQSSLVKKQFPDVVISRIFNFKTIEEITSEIPNRNIHFVAAALQYGDTVALHGHKTSRFPDNTIKFRMNASSLLSISSGHPVSVFSPIEHLTKEELVEWYINDYKGEIEDLIEKTSSCFKGKHFCGECWHCFSFYCCLFPYLDRTTSPPVFSNKEIVQTYYEKAKCREFDNKRNRIIMQIAEKLL